MDSTEYRPRVCDLNENITCKLCNGYLVDATAITECGHVFCKSCIVRHLHQFIKCPVEDCGIIAVHSSQPFKYLKGDPQTQDLVNKVVPGLITSERQRKDEFYKSQGIPNPENTADEKNTEEEPEQRKAKFTHNENDRVGIELLPREDETHQIPFRYCRVSSFATINQIQKLLKRKDPSADAKKMFDIYYKDEILGKDHTLKFILLSRFRTKKGPLQLHYQLTV